MTDAELQAGPYTSDIQYMDSMRKVDTQIQQLKTEYGFQGSGVVSNPAFGTAAKLKEQIRCKVVSLADGVELPFEKVEHLLKDGADPKEMSVFLMQSRLLIINKN